MTPARRHVLAGGMALLGGGRAVAGPAPIAPPRLTVLYEQTYLKAKPGRRADLVRYVTTNWFAMDRKGVEQGIFTDFWLLEEADANPAWDLVMVVGYPQLAGYDDPATTAAFTAIRAAHVEVRIDGRGLDDLGTIAEHRRLRIVAA